MNSVLTIKKWFIESTNEFKVVLSLIFLLSILSLSAVISINVTDFDSLYHIKHSLIYRETGIFDTNFPWTIANSSYIKSDLWYGFHILQIPFTFLEDLSLGIILSGIVFSFATISIFYFVVMRLGAKTPLIWTILFFGSNVDTFMRITMNRPHVLSTGIILLIFYFLIEKGIKKYSLKIFFASFLLSFVHINLAWLALLVWLIIAGIWVTSKVLSLENVTLSDLANEPKVSNIFSIILGLIAGLITRPDFINTIYLQKVQVWDVIISRLSGSIYYQNELRNLNLFDLNNLLFFLIPFSLALFTFALQKNKLFSDNPEFKLPTYFLIAIIFTFLIMSLYAFRANIYFVMFGAIFSGLILEKYLYPIKTVGSKIVIICLQLMIFSALTISLSGVIFLKTHAINPLSTQPAALWLSKNSSPGELVVNLFYSDFSALYFWNNKNKYLYGFGEIFLEHGMPDFYKEVASLKSCKQTMKQNDFDRFNEMISKLSAKYFYITNKQVTPCIEELLKDKNTYSNVYADDYQTIYELNI